MAYDVLTEADDAAHRSGAVHPGRSAKVTSSRDVARGLAWFGIGLGLAELFAPRALAKATGLQGHETLLQVFGAREILSGVLILAADDPLPWLWTRVAGDIADSVVLAGGMNPSNLNRRRTVLATLAVAPVVALDLIYALPPE